MYAAWTVKYKPKTLGEVVGHRNAIAELVSWLRSWEKGIPKKRAAFLHGPPGIGKTLIIIQAIQQGYQYLADDLAIADSSGYLQPCLGISSIAYEAGIKRTGNLKTDFQLWSTRCVEL